MDEHMSDHLNQRGRNYLLELERDRYQTMENIEDTLQDMEGEHEADEGHDHETTLCCWEQGSRHFFGNFTKNLYGITQDDFSIVRINAEGDGKFVRLLNVDQSSVLSADTIVSSSFITRSDKRLKSNITKLGYDPNLIQKFNIVTFNYIGKTGTTIGMIAQEVKKIDPNLVCEDKETSMLSISYNDILCLTIQHAQELEKRVSDLENPLTQLKFSVYSTVRFLNYFVMMFFTVVHKIIIRMLPIKFKQEWNLSILQLFTNVFKYTVSTARMIFGGKNHIKKTPSNKQD